MVSAAPTSPGLRFASAPNAPDWRAACVIDTMSGLWPDYEIDSDIMRGKRSGVASTEAIDGPTDATGMPVRISHAYLKQLAA